MSTAPAVAVQSNPFPGLRPFREDEEYVFFGRESQVDAMVNKLADIQFLAVVGTSGSGKSSLVNCGLRPALHGGLMAGAGTAWRIAQFRPGSDPLRAMAHALAEDGVLFRDYQAGGLTLAEIVDTTLRMSKLGLIDIYEQAQLGEDVNLLVVVDQFEELFRYRQLGAAQEKDISGMSEAATAFVNLLLEAKEQTTCPIYVVLTMRSDFLGDCAQFTGLAEAINAGQYLVPRMTRDERRSAISGPVRVGGAEIAPVLLTRLVNDVGDNPDQLSILQHALNRTWARWQHEGGGEGPLDLAHYEAIGTMAHALDQHAETAYAELGSTWQQQICEKLFKALTDKATDPRGVRRPTTLGTLCALADATAAEVTEVMDVFRQPSRSFLMPPAGEVLETETVIDISHESLMRVWQRLNTWADEEAQSARMYRRLADTAARHAAGKASSWTGPDLQLAFAWRDHDQPNETWAERYSPGYTTAMRFLDESRKIQEGNRQRELASTKAVWFLVPLMLLLAVIISVISIDPNSPKNGPNYLTSETVHNLTYLYIPLAAWLGYAFRRTGVLALAMGAFLLLPPGWEFFEVADNSFSIPNNVGLYLVSLAVCQIFAEPDGFFAELNRFRDTRKFYLLAFLLLGVTAKLSLGPLFVDLGLEVFAFGVFFVIGMSPAPARRFALALALAVAIGSFLKAFTLNPIEVTEQLRLNYWLSSPWYFVLGVLIFACGRLTRNALSGRDELRGWSTVAIAGLALVVIFAGRFANFELTLSPFAPKGVRYLLLGYSTSLTYVAAFTVALLLGVRGLGAILIAGAGALIVTTTADLPGVWQPYERLILDGAVTLSLFVKKWIEYSGVEVILIFASFGLLGNAVRKRFNAIGDGYALAEDQAAVRAAEEAAHRTRRWLRWILISWGFAVVLLICLGLLLRILLNQQ